MLKKPERFKQLLKRAIIHNVVSENLFKKNKSRQIKELVNVRGTRDMFGQFLYLAVRKEIDLNTVFHYSEPPCFADSNRSFPESKKNLNASFDERKY